MLVALDFSIIYVALPEIGAALNFSDAALQWIVSAYAIAFAGFLLLGGQLVDALGSGRLFLFAQFLFAAASVVAASSSGAAGLILARGCQGVGAAFLVPATLSLLSAAYPPGPARNRALGVWGTTGAMGLALGVTAGGLLLTIGSWPWIFWFNLPVVAGCLIAAVPALRFSAGRPTPFNLSGSVLASATVVAVVLVGTELARPAPSGRIVAAAFATSFTAFALFVATQRRAARPLVTPALLRVRTLRVACAVAALYMASFGAEFFLVTLYLQEQRGYTALAAGLAFLPLAATIVVGNTVAGRVANRWSLCRLLSVAYFIGAVGLAILGLAAATSGSYAGALLPGLLISGLGQGMAFTGMFITGTRDLPPESSGTGSALVATAQYTGGSIGLAALVLIQGQQPDAQTYAVAFTITAAVALTAIPIVVTVLRAEEGAPVRTT